MKPGKPLQRRTPMPRGTKPLVASSSLSRSPVKRRSRKRASETVLYGLARALYLAAHEVCERCSSAPAVDLHHKRGRGIYLAEPAYFAALCRSCHDHIESHRADAYAEGWLIRRNQRSAAA